MTVFSTLHGALALYLMPGWSIALVATVMFVALMVYFDLTDRLRIAETAFPDIFLLIFYIRYAVPPFFAPFFCGQEIFINGVSFTGVSINGVWFTQCNEVYSLDALLCLMIGQLMFSGIVLCLWPRRRVVYADGSESLQVEAELRGLVCCGVLFIIAILPMLYPSLAIVPSVNQVFLPSAYLALAILTTYMLGSRRYRPVKLLAFAVFAAYILKLISGAILTPALIAALIVLLVYYRRSWRLNLKWLAVIGLIFVTGYPATASFREHVWYGTKFQNASIVEKAMAFVSNFFEYNASTVACLIMDNTSEQACIKNGRLDLMLQRFAHLPHATRAMATTPSEIDYWNGESYKPLLFSLIPRALYPDKPLENLGRYFATDYWSSKTPGMSMNLPVEVEAYLNFGRIGLVLSPALLALIFLAIQKLPLGRIPENANLKLLLALPLIFPDGNFSLIFGNAPKFLIFYATLLFVVGWMWNRLKPFARD